MELTMKYADTHEITAQFELASLCSKSRRSFRETIKLKFTSLFTRRFDPTRLTGIERREMGVTECDIDWHNAFHGPVIK